MKFLVILICVTANYFWKQDLDRIDDSWFFALRHRLVAFVDRSLAASADGWLVLFVLTFLVPLLVLGLVLVVADGVLYGLITMVVHVFILLMAFDRTHPGLLAQEYLEHWRAGDTQAGFRFLARELAFERSGEAETLAQMHRVFGRLYVYRCFEKMFVMFFWYLLAGPLGVLLAYIAYQLRDAGAVIADAREPGAVAAVVAVLEWAPLRLLGLTLCLVGNFERCFSRLRQTGLQNDGNTDLAVYELALAALELAADGASDASQLEPGSDMGGAAGERYRSRAAGEVEALRGLMERSQVLWLIGIALITVFAW